MPFFMHKAKRWHCFVGLERAFNILALKLSRLLLLVLIFPAISSAAFSALFFVLAKTNACFPKFNVSRAKSNAAFPVSIEIFFEGINGKRWFGNIINLLVWRMKNSV